MAAKANINPYPKFVNLGRFIVDSNKFSKEITIKKSKNNIKLKEYAAMSVVDSAIQYYLGKLFGTKTFADMLASDNFVYNKYIALQMRQHLDTEFNKLNPNHIKDVMIEFELPPTPDAPIGLYFAKQKKCISFLVDTNEPITNLKQQRTLLGYLLTIP